ncbi:Coq4 family protein [Pleurocapsa sp. FMAR1]|uniref:Coq4 family protein n=1 Tax=Pleurocapsa sp. FMAR1 TaxID=3040204 RepID=UPI0029C6A883|nr:Coq4 family protein [Pleurocapsa sp. FMAR1]
MPSIKRYAKALKDYFTTGETGDAAFGEIKFYGIGLNPALKDRLQDFVGYYPKIDLEELAQLPEGTLGYEYAQHMKQHNIQPLEISPDLREEADLSPFALRYTVTHDIFHILLGFDTSYAGEMGVFGFTVGQNYSKMLKIVEPLVLLIFCVIRPFQIKKIWECDRIGQALGKQAECLLTYRFEDNWARPIDNVRAELGLVLSNEQLEKIESTPMMAKSQTEVSA